MFHSRNLWWQLLNSPHRKEGFAYMPFISDLGVPQGHQDDALQEGAVQGHAQEGGACVEAHRRVTPYRSYGCPTPSFLKHFFYLHTLDWCTAMYFFFGLTEEEANLLRLYVDQPGYVDLHWVCCVRFSSICLFFACVMCWGRPWVSPTLCLTDCFSYRCRINCNLHHNI
jgi:hypothetical protein